VGTFIVRRLLLSVVVLFGVTVLVSGMLQVAGDPVVLMLQDNPTGNREQYEALRHELGLDKPFIFQYFDFVAGAAQGDLGKSIRFHTSALPIVLDRLPATVELALAAMVFALVIAVPLGILSAAYRNTPIDYAARLVALIGQSVPIFWIGIVLVMIFAVRLHWLPVAGRLEPTSLILPMITLGLYPMARIVRTLRASMSEQLTRDYCLTARSKGVSERTVLTVHTLRNAALPVITVIGLQLGALLGGSVVTETIFAWPGLGWLSIQALGYRDFPLIRAIVAVVAIMFIVINLLTDILTAYMDPRVRLS
jgi:peptide/nickel transport system permease protein